MTHCIHFPKYLCILGLLLLVFNTLQAEPSYSDAVTVTNEKELAAALNANKDTIIVEGNLSKSVLRIKATGKVAWGVVIGAVIILVAAILASPTPVLGQGAMLAAATTAPSVIAILSTAAAVTAISIAVYAGGAGALNKLRSYTIDSETENQIILVK